MNMWKSAYPCLSQKVNRLANLTSIVGLDAVAAVVTPSQKGHISTTWKVSALRILFPQALIMCSMRCSLILLLERIPYVRYPEISISKLSFALEYVKHSISAAPTPLIVDVRLGLRQVSWYPSLHCSNTPNFIDSAKPTCVWITSSRRQCLSSLRLWKRLQLAILLRGITVQRVELCSTMNEARSF